MKVVVTVKQTEVSTFDIGDLPLGLVRDLLQRQGDGTFDGIWSSADIRPSGIDYTTDSIEVVEAPAKVGKG